MGLHRRSSRLEALFAPVAGVLVALALAGAGLFVAMSIPGAVRAWHAQSEPPCAVARTDGCLTARSVQVFRVRAPRKSFTSRWCLTPDRYGPDCVSIPLAEKEPLVGELRRQGNERAGYVTGLFQGRRLIGFEVPSGDRFGGWRLGYLRWAVPALSSGSLAVGALVAGGWSRRRRRAGWGWLASDGPPEGLDPGAGTYAGAAVLTWCLGVPVYAVLGRVPALVVAVCEPAVFLAVLVRERMRGPGRHDPSPTP